LWREDGADGDLDTSIVSRHPLSGLLCGDEDIFGGEMNGLAIEFEINTATASER
jgi:hypothetical protein